jgi:hypothetical protein
MVCRGGKGGKLTREAGGVGVSKGNKKRVRGGGCVVVIIVVVVVVVVI